MRGLLTVKALAAIRQVADCARAAAVRRDLIMAGTGFTPRSMSVVSAQKLPVDCGMGDIYGSKWTHGLLAAVTGQRPQEVRHSVEWGVANFLEARGDTHGAHRDDYPIAFVLIVRAPNIGGEVLYSPTNSDELSGVLSLAAGDAYAMRADRILHAVAPVSDGTRAALVFAYNFAGNEVQITPSASMLYE